MIAKLSGIVDSVGEDWAVIDVSGVGYQVYCSGRTLSALPRPGGRASLYVETRVRDDNIHLYGFAERSEREWFRLLQTVQGVGARVALAVLTVLTPEGLRDAIAAQDKGPLCRASGVGTKLAQRVVSELRDKVASPLATVGSPSASMAAQGNAEDAVSALVNLGYPRTDAFGAVARAARELGGEAPLESLIRLGLRELSP